MSSEPAGVPLRCTRHPGRPAQDSCPQCDRPRCGADVAAYGDMGCAVCRAPGRPRGQISTAEVVVRSGAACVPVAAAGGWVATQYVNDHIFSLVVPGLVGFACAAAASAVCRRHDRSAVLAIMAVAAIGGVIGTALGFHLVPGGRQSVIRPANVVAAPYLCSLAGVVAWRILFGPVRRRRPYGDESATSRST